MASLQETRDWWNSYHTLPGDKRILCTIAGVSHVYASHVWTDLPHDVKAKLAAAKSAL